MSIMKITVLALLFACFLSAAAQAGDNNPKAAAQPTWLGFDAGMKEARRTNKKVFVDVYTDWCGWCKKMDKEVFSHAAVGPYLSEQYVLVRLNAESAAKVSYKDTQSSEMELARKFGVTGYPTSLFFEPNGDLITSLPGYVKADDFMAVLKYFAESHYKKLDWQAFYDQYRKDNPPGSLH
jgi:thioredoxin-related protein